MQPAVYIASSNIFSPVGKTTAENFVSLSSGQTGVKKYSNPELSPEDFYASLFETDQVIPGFTKFESILVSSLTDALIRCQVKPQSEETILIISSTKGNISQIETGKPVDPGEISLSHSAGKIRSHFGFLHSPLVVSNACISGILALIVGKRLIESGKYGHAVVAGADVISSFILSGFQSFQAISNGPCKPFDLSRNGINLGEAAGTIVLTANKAFSNGVRLAGGSVSNDANHISGPSRTGEELAEAISKAIKESGMASTDVDFISAHGTATIYNDEMEAKAFQLAGVNEAPLNSLKGFYGHTLGAAGIIESIISIESLLQGKIMPTPGYAQPGTTVPVQVISKLIEKNTRICLKTGSGFGGCNAAVIFQTMNKQYE